MLNQLESTTIDTKQNTNSTDATLNTKLQAL